MPEIRGLGLDPFQVYRADFSHWTIAIARLDNVMGLSDPVDRIIWITNDLTDNEFRCTLLHELIHARRGDIGQTQYTERIVQRETARRLVVISELAEYSSAGMSMCDAADAIRVDCDTLRTRLRYLSARDARIVASLGLVGMPADSPASVDYTPPCVVAAARVRS